MEFISLVSKDGQRVVLPRDAALASGTLSGLQAFQQRAQGEDTESVSLPTVEQGQVLEKVGEYVMYRSKWEGDSAPAAFDIPTEMALELLVVADYLDL